MGSPRVFPNRHLSCQFGALDKGGEVGKIKMKSAQLHQKATNLDEVSCKENWKTRWKKRIDKEFMSWKIVIGCNW